MSLIESIDIPLGSQMPKFVLLDPSGVEHISDNTMGMKGLLVVFTCNHCPYAKAVWPRMIRLGQYALEQGIKVLAINPNINPKYPEDSPDEMRKKIREWGIPFPYLIDSTQKVAREFKAQCTPDIYLFDCSQKLVYHGRLDDNWQDEKKVTRQELREAIDNLIEGNPIAEKQFPSMGCSIKWLE
jgi:peroxiredoxin